jgi:hypothetical protein
MANWNTKAPHKNGMGKSTSAYGDNKLIKKDWAKSIRLHSRRMIKKLLNEKPD